MDETYDTISRINEKFNKMSKSHKKLATFVIDHYEQAAFMTAAKLARAVGKIGRASCSERVCLSV